MFKQLIIFTLITKLNFFKQNKETFKRYEKSFLDFLNKNQFSLVLAYQKKQPWFTNLKKLSLKNKLPIHFMKISSKNQNHAFNLYQIQYFLNLRFYMGHPRLYSQYLGNVNDDKQNPDNINRDVQNFIKERLKKSFIKIDNKKKNIKDYLNFLFNQNQSFLFYNGQNTKSQCFKLFMLFSQASDKFIISHWKDDVFKGYLLPKIQERENIAVTEGFYLRKNYQDKTSLEQICKENEDFKVNKTKLLQTMDLILLKYYEPLKQLKMEEIYDQRIKYFLIMNQDFFRQKNIDAITKSYLNNLQVKLDELLRQYQFHAQKKETQKVKCYFINSQVNQEEFNFITNLVGHQNKNNFLFVLKRHQYKPEYFHKYKLDISDPTKIQLNFPSLIDRIKKKKIKPFLKSGISPKVQIYDEEFRQVTLNDIKNLIQKHMAERLLFYCLKEPNDLILTKLKDFKKQKLVVYLIDMKENEIVQMLQGVKHKDEYYLLKEPMSTELISASWETVESPYTWQGAGDEL